MDGQLNRCCERFARFQSALKRLSEANSPRNAIRLAMQMGIVSNTEWMSMLESINTMAHVYDEEEADSIIDELSNYHNMLVAFEEVMVNKLSEIQ